MKITRRTSVVLLAISSTIALSGVATHALASTVATQNSDVGATFKSGGSTTGGPLSIDFTSNWQFGEMEVVAKDMIFYAQPENSITPLYVQVTDIRGSFAGWTLSLEQAAQFEDDKGNELTGAALSFKGTGVTTSTSSAPATSLPTAAGFTLTPGSKEIIVGANINEGTGENNYLFGSIADYDTTATDGKQMATKGPIELSVAAGSMRAAIYKSSLVWTLEDTPAP